ncbi:MAG: hypothetical protein ACI85I_001801 [Arenicella sp.]|jgi:hypothetical protein
MVQPANHGDVIPGQYIVVFKNSGLKINKNTSFETARKAVKDFGGSVLRANKISADVQRSYGKAIQGIVAQLSSDDVSRLENDSRVAYVEQDRQVAVIFKGKPGSGGGFSCSSNTLGNYSCKWRS